MAHLTVAIMNIDPKRIKEIATTRRVIVMKNYNCRTHWIIGVMANKKK